jgi:hypothetical protein
VQRAGSIAVSSCSFAQFVSRVLVRVGCRARARHSFERALAEESVGPLKVGVSEPRAGFGQVEPAARKRRVAEARQRVDQAEQAVGCQARTGAKFAGSVPSPRWPRKLGDFGDGGGARRS